MLSVGCVKIYLFKFVVKICAAEYKDHRHTSMNKLTMCWGLPFHFQIRRFWSTTISPGETARQFAHLHSLLKSGHKPEQK